jgi:hypothetical protein
LYLPFLSQVKDQGKTKDEPRNDLPTPNLQKVLFIKIIPIPKKVDLIPKKVVSLPKKVDSNPNNID